MTRFFRFVRLRRNGFSLLAAWRLSRTTDQWRLK